MKETIIVRPERCIGCGVCIRSCPAPEANIIKKLENGKMVATVDPAMCIGCGECIARCRRGAREYIDDTDSFMSKLDSNDEMILIVDPTFKAAYPLQWTGVLDWFKKKNCIILDGAFGADIYVWVFLSLLESGRVRNIIDTSCASVMNYVRMYRPELLKRMAPIYPPFVCSAIYVKNYLKRENKIAVLSSCVARRNECAESGFIDYSITFKKVMDYFSRNGISIPNEKAENYEYNYSDMAGQMGVALSRPEGLRDNVLMRMPDAYIETNQGLHNVYKDLIEYEKQPEKKLPHAFDVHSCAHGCISGPGCGTGLGSFEMLSNLRAIETEAKEKMKGKSRFKNNNEDKLFKRFDEEFELDNFLRVFRPLKAPPAPTEVELTNAFALMEKKTGVDRTYNCGSCGYATCREMAVAVHKGLNLPENCAQYRKKHTQPLSDEEKKYEDILNKCKEVATKLGNGILTMSGDMNDIADYSEKAAEKAKSVNGLMKNIISFCGKNPTMDENSLKQMIKILQTTGKSLATIEDNIGRAGINSHSVSDSVGDIDKLIVELKNILDNKSSEE